MITVISKRDREEPAQHPWKYTIRIWKLCILLKWSLSQSSSAVDNVISPPSSPVSGLGMIVWESQGKKSVSKKGALQIQ